MMKDAFFACYCLLHALINKEVCEKNLIKTKLELIAKRKLINLFCYQVTLIAVRGGGGEGVNSLIILTLNQTFLLLSQNNIIQLSVSETTNISLI